MRCPAAIVCVALGVVLTSAIYSKTVSGTFEVASVKPHGGSQPPLAMTTGRRFIATNYTLSQLVLLAHSDQSVPLLKQFLVGGPRWTQIDGFDIEAVAADAISLKQSHLMLQSLLLDRFQLRLHREARELPVYDLVIVKHSKLKLSDDQTPVAPEFSFVRASQRARGAAGLVGDFSAGPRVIMRGTAVTLSTVASMLQAWGADRPVIDKTGLRGLYDVEVKLPQTLGAESDQRTGPVASDPALNPMFASLEEQVGLKLTPSTGLVDVFVIDSAEKPSTN